jgi:hypothetical protein
MVYGPEKGKYMLLHQEEEDALVGPGVRGEIISSIGYCATWEFEQAVRAHATTLGCTTGRVGVLGPIPVRVAIGIDSMTMVAAVAIVFL